LSGKFNKTPKLTEKTVSVTSEGQAHSYLYSRRIRSGIGPTM